jgi:hypothetical protein
MNVKPGREVPDPVVRRKAIGQMLEMTEWHKTRQLRETGFGAPPKPPAGFPRIGYTSA